MLAVISPKPPSRPRKGCAPCHPRWDQGLSDSGPSACGPPRRSAPTGRSRPGDRAARSVGTGPDLQHRPETALCRSTGRPAARCRGPRAAGPLRRRGRTARARRPEVGDDGRPEVGDDGRPAQNGEEGRRRSEGASAERCQARPGAETVPWGVLRGPDQSPHLGPVHGDAVQPVRGHVRKLHLAQAGEGDDRRRVRKWPAPPDLTPPRSCPASMSRLRTPMSTSPGTDGLRITS